MKVNTMMHIRMPNPASKLNMINDIFTLESCFEQSATSRKTHPKASTTLKMSTILEVKEKHLKTTALGSSQGPSIWKNGISITLLRKGYRA